MPSSPEAKITVRPRAAAAARSFSTPIMPAAVQPDNKYYWSRKLGVQQQWFLFDNPPKRSFWFRIVGEDVQGNQYDLHKMTLLYSQPPTITSTIDWIKSYTTTDTATATN